MPMFAVGKPIVLPILSPLATFPLIEKGLPKKTSAVLKSPSVSSFLISELLTRRPSIDTALIFSIAKFFSMDIFFSIEKSPSRPLPKRKSSPIKQ